MRHILKTILFLQFIQAQGISLSPFHSGMLGANAASATLSSDLHSNPATSNVTAGGLTLTQPFALEQSLEGFSSWEWGTPFHWQLSHYGLQVDSLLSIHQSQMGSSYHSKWGSLGFKYSILQQHTQNFPSFYQSSVSLGLKSNPWLNTLSIGAFLENAWQNNKQNNSHPLPHIGISWEETSFSWHYQFSRGENGQWQHTLGQQSQIWKHVSIESGLNTKPLLFSIALQVSWKTHQSGSSVVFHPELPLEKRFHYSYHKD